MDALSSSADWRAALDALPDGASPPPPIVRMLEAEIARRAAGAECGAGWSAPRLSDLAVRRDGLPEGWTAGGNLLLAGPGAGPIVPEPGLDGPPARNGLLVLGEGARLHKAHFTGEGAMIVVGDRANLYAATLSARSGGTVVIGERTTATWIAQLDARNGGAILVGADGMWASGVRMLTDDMHAIRDIATGRRVNRFGGRIVVEPHVWLGEQVTLLGDCRVGADSVVGLGALVKGASLPPNTVSAGRPARVVREGVTWSRDDLP